MASDTHVEQVGGTHYSAPEGQGHWDLMERYDVDYLTATATKYLTRWRKKGTPRLDLGKAASYIEKALLCRPGWGTPRLVPQEALDQFYAANKVELVDGMLMTMLLGSGKRRDVELTLASVRVMIEDVE